MKAKARAGADVLKQTFKEFSTDGCARMAAALSYYTVVSLPPLLVLVLLTLGPVLEPQDVQQRIERRVEQLMGPQAARQTQAMIENAGADAARTGTLGAVLGIGALLFGATGAFAQLQDALNAAWEVRPDPKRNTLLNFALKRLLSLAMILGIAALLLASTVAGAVIEALGNRLGGVLPGGVSSALWQLFNTAASLGVITVLFAALFKVLPDAKVAWRDVWTGAAVTALLFVLGKLFLGIYLGRSNPGSAYGAAGSLAVMLVWIYYSAMILLLGAEFTQVWARSYGKRIEPSEGAIRVFKDRDPEAAA